MLKQFLQGAGGVGGAILPIEFVTSASDSTPTATSSYTATYTSTELPNCQSGDIAILAISDDATETFTVSAGWTAIYTDSEFDAVSSASLYYRVLTGTFPTTTITNTIGITAFSTSIAVYRNATYNTTVFTGANIKDPAAVTTTDNGAVIIVMHGKDDPGTGTLTPPSGYTVREEIFGGDSAYSTTWIADKITGITASSTDPAAIGGTFTNKNFMRIATLSLDEAT